MPAVAVAMAMAAVTAGLAAAQSLPGSPSIIQATPASGEVAVFWEAPADTGGPGITVDSYDLRWIASNAADKSDANWTELDRFWTSGVLSGTVTGLTNGTRYDFEMRATTSAGDGPWSKAVLAAPRDSPPTVTAVSAGEKAVTVAWTAPPEITDADTVAYQLRWIASNAADKSDGNWTTGTAEAKPGWRVVEPLQNGVSYDIQVRAFSDHPSSWSATSRVVPADAPGAALPSLAAIAVGIPTAAALDSATDADFFKLELSEPTLLMLRTTGPAGDTICHLLDGSGDLIVRNDDGRLPDGGGHCMILHSLDAGTYFVSVIGWRSRSSNVSRYAGSYQLHAVPQDGPGATRATAAPIAKGEVKAGDISSATDADWISVTGGADDEFVSVKFRPAGYSYDIGATLVDAAGNELALSSSLTRCFFSSCWSIGFDLDFELPANTTYWIRVESRPFGNDRRGPYAFTMRADTAYADFISRCRSTARPAEWADELSGCQWHLHNTGQRVGAGRGASREDANVRAAHAAGYLGAGATVSVVDDGFDTGHADLAGNASPSRSHTLCAGDPSPISGDSHHGSAVAGLVAARDNTIGMRGVAPRAQIYNVRYLGCDLRQAAALPNAMTLNMEHVGVSVNSWGKRNDPGVRPVDAVWSAAVEQALLRGFGGKGTVFVFAGGNGHADNDWSGLSEFLTHHGTIPVCAVNADGKSAYYSERGPNLWVCAPSGGRQRYQMATLAHHDRYWGEFIGTSAATPIVGGVAALVRAENPDLTWRDVKLILAGSARRNHPTHHQWGRGAAKYSDPAARYWFSPLYGFGVVDAHAAVTLAQNWRLLPEMLVSTATPTGGSLSIPDDRSTVTSSVAFDDTIEFVEYVEIDTVFGAASFRDLRVELVSPSGAVSLLSPAYASSTHYPLYEAFRFGSSKHLGESARGTWTLRISDRASGKNAPTLRNWSVTLYGHRQRPSAPTLSSVTPDQGSLALTWEAPAHAGASPLTGYEIRHIASAATNKADSEWTELSVPGGSSTLSHTLTVTQRGSRDVQVRARNGGSAGPWSATLTGTVDAQNLDPYFAESATTRDVAENTASGTAIGTAGTATDADASASLTYTLGGAHAGSFAINASTGQMQTKAALDRESQAAYSLTVSVSDGLNLAGEADTSQDDTIDVTVRITDVDEPFTMACTARDLDGGTWVFAEPPPADPAKSGTQPAVNPVGPDPGDDALAVGSCAVDDPEGGTASWSASADDGALFEVDDGGTISFKDGPDYETPGDADGDNIHEFEVAAAVGSHTSSASVALTVTDVDEPAVISGPEAVSVDEGHSAQSALGAYTASDPEGASVTLRLRGPDAARFALGADGNLRFAATPDFESPADDGKDNGYALVVEANDGALTSERRVSVVVRDVDEAPTLAPASCSFGVAENTRGGWNCSFAVSDPEGRSVHPSLSGADAAAFELSGSGGSLRLALKRESVPDFETQPSYSVSVVVADSGPSSHRVSSDVSLAVTNVDEPGSARLSSRLASVGATLTASLSDPDGPTGVKWQWQRLGSGTSQSIAGATSATYTPTADDVGHALRAVASYVDGPFGSARATTASTDPVRAQTVNNDAPAFTVSTLMCSVRENLAPRRLPSCVSQATDPDAGDRVEYRIEHAGDTAPFAVDSAGRLSTTQSLDHEAAPSWLLTLMASDGRAVASLSVTVEVLDEDETEAVALDGLLRVGETVRASLEGGDCPAGSGCTVVQWRWEKSPDGRTWDIATAGQSGSFPLTTDVECHQVRVHVGYSDAHGAQELRAAVGRTGQYVLPASGDCGRTITTPTTTTRTGGGGGGGGGGAGGGGAGGGWWC